MRIVVIGGTGHIGTYLIPRLVNVGSEVIVIARGKRDPYQPDSAWASVQQINIDREQAEAWGKFGQKISELKPDIVIDLICFTLESCCCLVRALEGQVSHFLHCGSMWVYGHSGIIPTTENAERRPLDSYGIQKAQIEAYLLDQAHRKSFPATILHPGHIVGPGWVPVNPAGNFNLQVFSDLAAGREVILPNLGKETLHHVHADDVAQAFEQAIRNPERSIRESYNVVSPQALSLERYAEEVANHYGAKSDLSFLPWDLWKTKVSEEDAVFTWDHIRHSPCGSIEKAQEQIDYQPNFSSLEAIFQALGSLHMHI